MDQAIQYLKTKLEKENKTKLYKIFGEEWQSVLDLFINLPKHDLDKLNSIIRKIKATKYDKSRVRLLGNLSKAQPHNYFVQVLNHFSSLHGTKYKILKMLFEVQGYEGMRISDLLKLNLTDINFSSHEIKVYNSKSQRFYYVPIQIQVEKHLKQYVKDFANEIKDHDGYLFFSNAVVRSKPYLSPQFVNREFVKAMDFLKLNQTYAISKDGRKLNLYTTHSNRGHAATYIYKKSHGNLRSVQSLLNHSPKSYNITGLYIENSEDEVYKILRKPNR